MSKKTPKKSGSMGPVFAEFLAIYNYCEERMVAHEKNPGDLLPVQVDKLGSAVQYIYRTAKAGSDDAVECVNDLVRGWGANAALVRGSFKFKALHDDLINLCVGNPHLNDLEMELPFDKCTLVLNQPSLDAYSLEYGEQRKIEAVVMFIETRFMDESISGDWYDKNGLSLGQKFYSIDMAMKIPGDPNLFLIPAEIHVIAESSVDDIRWTCGIPKGIPDTLIDGMQSYGRFAINAMKAWLVALSSSRIKQEVTAGLKPGISHMPRRTERKFYEHTLLTIDPLKVVEHEEGMGHHSKHKLHPVRGFWRHYKSGKRTWITPHWRGDKELGVITHDYEVVNEYEVEDEQD